MVKYICVLFLISSVSFSETAVQTDWSGGEGVYGPVMDWGNQYYVSSHVDSSGGILRLSRIILAAPVEHTISDSLDGAYSVYAADVDDDGDIDAIGAGYIASDVIWWENTDGSGTVWIEHMVDSEFDGAVSVYSADIDNDDNMDILGAAMYADDITWWENTDGSGISWVKHTVDEDFLDATFVYSEDINGDGCYDVLGAAFSGDDITWWENADSSGTSWIEHTVDGDFNGAVSVYAADIDDDGYMDILGTAYLDDDITWWENADSSGTVWTEHTIDSEYDGAYSVYAEDVDGDDDMDVLGASYWGNDITWWENTDGSGTVWTDHTVDDSYIHAVSVKAADVDGDGDTDVLGVSADEDAITWWENTDGSGTAWIEHIVDDESDGAWSACADDVNNDGDMDILGAAVNLDRITWWEVKGYSEQGTLESSILDAGSVDTWDVFSSTSQEPIDTSVAFQFRSSSNSSGMGTWSDTIYSSTTALSGILEDSTRYLQYKVILLTSDPVQTPVLEDLEFSYSVISGIEAGNSDEITEWSLMIPDNPSFGHLSVLIAVPEPGLAEFVLYDLSGRAISEYSGEFASGYHSVNFYGLNGGIYFCVMNTRDCTATERVVVLR